MTLELIRHMIQAVVAAGGTPRTILLTVDDAQRLNIPRWTRQLFGLKVVIADNLLQSKVVTHIYDTVEFKTADSESDKRTKEKLEWLQ